MIFSLTEDLQVNSKLAMSHRQVDHKNTSPSFLMYAAIIVVSLSAISAVILHGYRRVMAAVEVSAVLLSSGRQETLCSFKVSGYAATECHMVDMAFCCYVKCSEVWRGAH